MQVFPHCGILSLTRHDCAHEELALRELPYLNFVVKSERGALSKLELALRDCWAFLSDGMCAFLCVPATSVPSESAFSNFGFLQDGRCYLSHLVLEKMMVVRDFLKRTTPDALWARYEEWRVTKASSASAASTSTMPLTTKTTERSGLSDDDE